MFPQKLACLTLCAAIGAMLAAYDGYVLFVNATNHTGADPYDTYYLLVPAAAISQLPAWRHRLWRLPLLLAVAGIINVAAFDRLGVMKEYDAWGRAGLPDRPAWSCLRLCR